MKPSDAVVNAVADALRLDVYERQHLFALAGDSAPDSASDARPRTPPLPDLERLVAGFEPVPAYAINARFDVLALNESARALLGEIQADPSGAPNIMWTAFTNPAWRDLIVDWEQEAARHAAMYRAAMTLHRDDPLWTGLPEELSRRSPDFTRCWSGNDVAGPERRLKRFRHPLIGAVTCDSTSLLVADDPQQRVVILQPVSANDATKLRRLRRERSA